MSRNFITRQSARYILVAGILAGIMAAGSSVGVANAEVRDNDKAGRVMLNVRGGPAFGLVNTDVNQQLLGSFGVDFGVAVSSGYNAYLVLTPQVLLRQDYYNVLVPLGFQYDIRLAQGLYLYPRVSVGYAAMMHEGAASGSLNQPNQAGLQLTHGGVGIPELGLKYVASGHFNVGFEPISIPILFTQDSYSIWYRVLLYVGGTF